MHSEGQAKPYVIERIVSALTYPTTGIIGIIWLIIGMITKSAPRKFTLYHIYQSIFLSLAYIILDYLIGIFAKILSVIPFINWLVAQILFFFNKPVLFGYSIIQTLLLALVLYLMTTAFMGKFSYLPFVSNNIKQLIK